MKGKDLPTLEWPPLIHGAYVSGRVQVRDFVLTVLAWGLLVYMVRGTLHLAYDYLRPPIFSFSSLSPPDWRELGGRLLPFWYFIAPLMLWLLVWALVRGRAMKTTEPVSQPPELAREVHAAGFGLDTETIAHWPEQRILVVHFDADGNISHGEVGGLAAPVEPAPPPASVV